MCKASFRLVKSLEFEQLGKPKRDLHSCLMRPFHGDRLLPPCLRIKVSEMTESNSVKQLESSLFYICSACYSTLVLKSFRGIA